MTDPSADAPYAGSSKDISGQYVGRTDESVEPVKLSTSEQVVSLVVTHESGEVAVIKDLSLSLDKVELGCFQVANLGEIIVAARDGSGLEGGAPSLDEDLQNYRNSLSVILASGAMPASVAIDLVAETIAFDLQGVSGNQSDHDLTGLAKGDALLGVGEEEIDPSAVIENDREPTLSDMAEVDRLSHSDLGYEEVWSGNASSQYGKFEIDAASGEWQYTLFPGIRQIILSDTHDSESLAPSSSVLDWQIGGFDESDGADGLAASPVGQDIVREVNEQVKEGHYRITMDVEVAADTSFPRIAPEMYLSGGDLLESNRVSPTNTFKLETPSGDWNTYVFDFAVSREAHASILGRNLRVEMLNSRIYRQFFDSINFFDTTVDNLSYGESIVDQFAIKVTDAEGNSESDTVSITINGTDGDPEVLVDSDSGSVNLEQYVSPVDSHRIEAVEDIDLGVQAIGSSPVDGHMVDANGVPIVAKAISGGEIFHGGIDSTSISPEFSAAGAVVLSEEGHGATLWNEIIAQPGDLGLGVFSLDSLGNWTFAIDDSQSEMSGAKTAGEIIDTISISGTDSFGNVRTQEIEVMAMPQQSELDLSHRDGANAGDLTNDVVNGVIEAMGLFEVPYSIDSQLGDYEDVPGITDFQESASLFDFRDLIEMADQPIEIVTDDDITFIIDEGQTSPSSGRLSDTNTLLPPQLSLSEEEIIAAQVGI